MHETHTTSTRSMRFFTLLPLLLPILFGTLLLLLLLFGILTHVLPQSPPYLTPHQEEIWLLSLKQRLPYAPLLYRVGLLHITRAPLFRATLLLTILTAWVHWTYAMYLGLWPRRGEHVPPLSPVAAESGSTWHVPRALDQFRGHVQTTLKRLGRVMAETPSPQEARFFLRRGWGGVWGSSGYFLGVILALLGIYWGLTRGWMTPPVMLTPSQPWSVGHGTDIQVTLHSVDEENRRAYIFVHRNGPGEKSRVYPLEQGKDLRVHGIHFRYVDTLIGLSLEATNQEDTPLPLQIPGGSAERQVILLFPESGREEVVLLPMHGLHIRTVGYTSLPEHGYDHPVFLIQVFRDGEEKPLYSAFVEQDTRIDVENIRLNVHRIAGIRIQAFYRPGTRWTWAGLWVLLLGSLVAVLWGPLYRLWVQVYGDERGVIIRAWGDVYNMGWHKPARRSMFEHLEKLWQRTS
ncbi:MAG: hypothetical protein GXO55_00825 [Chloroflexi bacterium]|nr:hypothetical protein [Chloroflexota bacterium]